MTAEEIDVGAIAALDVEDVDAERARRSYDAFRSYLDPGLIPGRWQADAARRLYRFYERLVAGERPKLAITAPPQHGKSRLIVDFLAWLHGREPDTGIVYTSFSDNLGVRANLRLQRMYDSPRYRRAFPGTRLFEANVVTQAAKPRRNSSLLEIVGRKGMFRNTTVRGSITGEGFDLGVIDDPIKGREEAESRAIRNKTWDWLNDDFFTRFSERSGTLWIQTRWHLDDPLGRLMEIEPDLEVVAYEAIAESPNDPLDREPGEPLFPEFKSKEFLDARKATMHPASWLSLYQQRPVPREGGVVKAAWFRTRYAARGANPRRVVATMDCASKPSQRNDPTSWQIWAEFDDHVELWEDVNERVEFPTLVKNTKERAARYRLAALLIEDKDAGQQLIQQLRKDTSLPVVAINPGGLDKVTRLETETPFIESGNVWLPTDAAMPPDPDGRGGVKAWLDEVTTIPGGAHDDRGDAFSQYLKWRREHPLNSGLVGLPGSVSKESNRL